MIELVAFLGNYGAEYAATRHNAPWLFASSLSYYDRLSWSSQFRAEYANADFAQFLEWNGLSAESSAQGKIHFIKPLTYMNASGEAVRDAAHFYKIPAEHILVVHDEIELPPGTLSLKFGGGLGGHNGLRSVRDCLGTVDFWRMRLGIGKCTDGNVYGYVLGRFGEDERITLSRLFPAAEELLKKLAAARAPARLLPEWSKKRL